MSDPGMLRRRLGRCSLELPGDLALCGQRYCVAGVRLIERPLLAVDHAGLWQQLCEQTAARGVVQQRLELSPDLPAICYHRDLEDVEWSIWSALLDAGAVALQLELECHEESTAGAPQTLRQLAAAYRLELPGETLPLSCGDGFFLTHGGLELPPGSAETLYARLERPGELEFCCVTEAPAAPDPETLLERWPEIRERLAAAGASVETLRARPRTAGNHGGEELCVSVQQAGHQTTTCTWLGQGEKGPCARTVLELEIFSQGLKEGLQVWDHLLTSMEL